MSSDLMRDAARRGIRYLDGLDKRGVAASDDALGGLEVLQGVLPDSGMAPDAVLDLLDEYGSPATTANAGPRYFGFVTGGTLPAAAAANWLAAAWDQNAFSFVSSPTTTVIEDVALHWLLELLGLPDACGGAFVTGATMANFCGLAAARHRLLTDAGWDVEARGLFGAPEVTVIVGEEAHTMLFKALGLLGLGRERVVRVPADGQGRMRADALPPIDGPTILCLQAGNVNTGAFDPANEICEPAKQAGTWIHVDGAFGLWVAVAPGRAHLMAGYEDCDSWATDGHKWLNVSYDSGICFVRDEAALRASMAATAAYLPSSAHRDPFAYTPESSRRARGVEIWAVLKSLGRDGLAELFERNCRQAARFAQGLAEVGHEILNDVVLNQVMVSFGDDERTRRVITGVQEEGTCWCGGTQWHGRAAMRISVSSWATRDKDVEQSIDAIIRVAQRTS